MSSKKKISAYRRVAVRLTGWYVITFLIIVLMTFVFLDYRLRHNLLKEVDRMLVDEAHEIVSEITQNAEEVTIHLAQLEKSMSQRKHYPISFRVFYGQGTMLYATAPIRGLTFPNCCPRDNGQKEIVTSIVPSPERRSEFRLCTFHCHEGGHLKYVVQVATYLRRLDKTTDNFRRNLVIAFFMSMVTGALGGWFLARRTLRPIEEITRSTHRITATNLSERLPETGNDDELDRLAATINDMLDRLEDSFRKLAQFTADAAHELRTPIAALRGEAEVLLSRERSLSEYREALINNLERLNFLTKLVNDLLLLSQADEGKGTAQAEDVRLTQLLRDLWDAFKVIAYQKDIKLTFEGAEGIVVRGNSLQLSRLFSNLIDNAIKYTPRNGHISMSLVTFDGRVTITIQDTGTGIPREDLPYIFDRFYRVDKSRARENGGAGLGLSICRWIVDTHHGTIVVESEPHRGTTVSVTLPAKDTPRHRSED